jgi:hypothetical protein
VSKRKGPKGARNHARAPQEDRGRAGTRAHAQDDVATVARELGLSDPLPLPPIAGASTFAVEIGEKLRDPDLRGTPREADVVADAIERLGRVGSAADKRQLIRDCIPALLDQHARERVANITTLARALAYTPEQVALVMVEETVSLYEATGRGDKLRKLREYGPTAIVAFLLDPMAEIGQYQEQPRVFTSEYRDAQIVRSTGYKSPAYVGSFRDALTGLAATRRYWLDLEGKPFFSRLMAQYGFGYSVTTGGESEVVDRLGLIDAAHLREAARAQREIVHRALDTALPCYVTPPIARLLCDAADTLAQVTPTADLIFCESGFLFFAEPVDLWPYMSADERDTFVFGPQDVFPSMPPADAARMRQQIASGGGDPDRFTINTHPHLRAIAWHPIVQDLAESLDNPAVLLHEARHVVLAAYLQHQPDKIPGIERAIVDAINYSYEYGIVLPLAGEGTGDPAVEREREPILPDGWRGHANSGLAYTIALWLSTMLFMRQQIVRAEPRAIMQDDGSRQERRARERDLAQRLNRAVPEVQVIALRQYADPVAPAHADAPAPGEVEWSCRWLVRGHWHTYRTGPGRQNYTPRYVQPFVKGPAGKPLRERPKVASVSR